MLGSRRFFYDILYLLLSVKYCCMCESVMLAAEAAERRMQDILHQSSRNRQVDRFSVVKAEALQMNACLASRYQNSSSENQRKREPALQSLEWT